MNVTAISKRESPISDGTETLIRGHAKLVEIASLRNLLSPIRRVPTEILSEFFELSCLPENGIFEASHDIVRRTSTLSEVCIAWKHTYIATPRLWSKHCLSFRRLHHAFSGDTVWFKEWISRSQDCPLDDFRNPNYGRAVGYM
ncbi:hypothetical protein BT96DRAFT_1016054 [Gymnopus androsaceus JB14]|uniref:F-box domain-containing protein n=1 Tax=Gymnopus androsaceus JB14 TaxID=1447944 RepID=A0A6A4I673_9AGAR|nr:hypothetical protein BT96DRAFT_1016054 [Gymnopus androsaceus JB14]